HKRGRGAFFQGRPGLLDELVRRSVSALASSCYPACMAAPAVPSLVARASPRGVFRSYGSALALAAAAVLLRYLLDRWMGDALPLVTLFGAVAGAVWIGGTGPAIVTAIAGYVGCNYLFIQPRLNVGVAGSGDVIGVLAYLFTCSLIVAFGEMARRSHTHADERG